MAENSPSTDAPFLQDGSLQLGQIEEMLQFRLGHRIRDLRIWVEPHGIILSGYAASYYDKQMAQHMIRELTNLGVGDNRIVVNAGAELTGGRQLDQFQQYWSYRDIVEGRHRPRHGHRVRR